MNPVDDADSARDGAQHIRDILATLIAIAGIGGLSLLMVLGCAMAVLIFATSLVLHLH